MKEETQEQGMSICWQNCPYINNPSVNIHLKGRNKSNRLLCRIFNQLSDGMGSDKLSRSVGKVLSEISKHLGKENEF